MLSDHTVYQLNSRAAQIKLPAEFQHVTDKGSPRVLIVPYLAYMPEKDRVLMSIHRDRPLESAVAWSDDHGRTWSDYQWCHTDAAGNSDVGMSEGLAYMGDGKATLSSEAIRIFSADYGQTWDKRVPLQPTADGRPSFGWDPPYVDRDSQTGKVVRLAEGRWAQTGVPWGSTEGHYSRAFVRFSEDEGRTWSDEINVPQWPGVSEVALVRAANGDMIAACRPPMPKRFAEAGAHDHSTGIGISISSDDGYTWSPINFLFQWGRHHPGLVLMPSGDLVMSYVVRLGYPVTADGYPQYGIEAVVSHDHGQTWDLDHRYILYVYQGPIKVNAPNSHDYWDGATQGTSTVVLPDGALLTTFGSGYRVASDPALPAYNPRDIGLVKWRLNDGPVNDDKDIAEAPFDSDLRNEFDPMARR